MKTLVKSFAAIAVLVTVHFTANAMVKDVSVKREAVPTSAPASPLSSYIAQPQAEKCSEASSVGPIQTANAACIGVGQRPGCLGVCPLACECCLIFIPPPARGLDDLSSEVERVIPDLTENQSVRGA